MAVVVVASGVGAGTLAEEVAVLGEVAGLGVFFTIVLIFPSLALLLVFRYWEARYAPMGMETTIKR